MEIIQQAVPVAMLSFVLSSMLAMGLSLTLAQILDPLRNIRLLVLALAANFLLMPLCAIALTKMLNLDPQLGVGLLLLGTAAGAPFLPKLVELAKGSLPYAVGLMVLLMVITVAYLPLMIPVFLPGVSVDPTHIAKSLIMLMMLPLALGLIVKSRFDALAARLKSILAKISNVSLILLIVLITVANFNNVVSVFGTRGILAAVVFLALGVVIGWLLGGPRSDTRKVMALGTSQRNIAAALVVGNQNFDDPNVVVMIVVVAIIGLLILMPFSRLLSKRT